jgi:hypothetical protein
MKFKVLKDIKDDHDIIATAALSKFSAISYLAKTGTPLKMLMTYNAYISEIECGLWSLVPLAQGKDESTYQSQFTHITKKIDILMSAIKNLRENSKS